MKATARDKLITNEIHRIFWLGNWQSKPTLIICYLTRIPAYAAYNTFIPLFSAYAIQAILTRHFSRVHGYAIDIIVLSVVYCICWTIGNISISMNAIRGSQYVQNRIFSNFLQKDYDFFSNSFFGSLGDQASRLRDAYNNYGEIVTLSVPKQITIVLTGIGVIAFHSLLLAGVTLVSMIAVLSFTLWSSTWRLQYRRKVSSASSDISAAIGDALSHGTTVKSFAMENYEDARLQKPLNVWSKAQLKSWLLANPADNGRMLLAAVATVVLLVLSAHLYEIGKITITLVVLVQLYVIRLVASTLDIAEIVKRYEEVMGAAYEPLQTMQIANQVNDPVDPKRLPKKSSYTLTLDKVSYRYAESSKNQQAVKQFSLTVKPGEKIGLVGYSGSGKTTLTKLLLRFMDVSNGAIMIDNVDIRNITQVDLRSIISYVPQEPLLFHRTIAENITYAMPGATQADILRAAKLAYVDEFTSELPDGFNTLVGERGVMLSGGQRQRVAIARALLKDSPILVLDEATSALDSKSEKYIQDALWELMKDRTALVIAHRLSTLNRMDRIIVLDKGTIVQMGSHDTLLKEQGIYAELWKHQSGGYIGENTNDVKQ